MLLKRAAPSRLSHFIINFTIPNHLSVFFLCEAQIQRESSATVVQPVPHPIIVGSLLGHENDEMMSLN